MTNTIQYVRAQRRAALKIAFYAHLSAFVVVNLLMVIVNLMLTPGFLWFYWPLIGWGTGVVVHGVLTFYGEQMLERLTAKEMEKSS